MTPPEAPDGAAFNMTPPQVPDTAAFNMGPLPGAAPPYAPSGSMPNGTGPAAPVPPDPGQVPGTPIPWPPHSRAGVSGPQTGPLAPHPGSFPPPPGALPPPPGAFAPPPGELPPPPGALPPPPGAFAQPPGELPPPPGALPPLPGAFAAPPGAMSPHLGALPPQTGFPPDMGGGFPAQPPSSSPGRGPSRGKKVLTVAAGILVLAAAAGAIAVLRSHSAQTPQAAPTSPAPTHRASVATPQPTLASKIDSVATDPKPITRAEIFPNGRVTIGGRQFALVAAVVNRKCALAARGSFAAALTASGCERVVRATYVDSSKRFAVTAGVAALPTKALAERVNRAKKLKRNVWFAALNGKP